MPAMAPAMTAWDPKSEKRMNPHKFPLISLVCGTEA